MISRRTDPGLSTSWAFAGSAESFAFLEEITAGQAFAWIYSQPVTLCGDTFGDMFQMIENLLFPDREEMGDILGVEIFFFE